MGIYDTLNGRQQEACFHTEGPVLILAGAGSGKTRVITHRISYLMEECGVNPWNILAITFTNKAAGEMRERVDKLIGFGAESVWISTFHSMCVRILRRHIDQIGYDSNFTIYDSDDQKTLIRQICRRMELDTKQFRERSILAAISQAKNELETAHRYQENHRADFREQKIGEVYAEYEKALASNNALDFDDLLMKTVELFSAREDVLRNYQERFRYIMVDEYQDTNRAQFEIVRMLAAGSRNLCVVGDDDQSIYKFRGADIRNILDFEKVYPDAFVVRLEQNYRSTQNILDAANAVIAHNTSRKEKKLWTDRGEGSRIHFCQFAGGNDEASFIAGDIKRKMRENPRLSYRDFAILYRTNAQSRLLEDRLVMESIPYNIVGGHNFYDRMEVRDILSYLRTINNGRDDISTQRIINIPKRGIGKTTIDRVAAIANEKEIGFYEVLENIAQYPELARARNKVEPFTELIDSLRDYAGDHSVEELIKKIVSETEYEDYLEDYEEETAEDRIANVDELISKAAAYEEQAEESEDTGGPSLSGFLEEVSLVAEIDEVGENDERVLLMTLHSAKGLEFPCVYLAGMEDGIFPSFQSISQDSTEALEEERRLAYVGITRAKDDLTITSARGRMIRGEMQFNPVSRFVLEIPEKLLDEPAGGYAAGSSWSQPEDDLGFAGASHTFGNKTRDVMDMEMPWNTASYGHSSGYCDTHGSAGSSGSFGGRVGASDLPDKKAARSADGRPRATYVRPHTSSDKKPFLSGKAGLDSLSKGIPAGTKPDYEVGDRVEHIKYGTGVVEQLEKGPRDYKVKVTFDQAGTKVMYAAFAKLKKL